MRDILRFLGFAGLVLFVFGLVSYLLTGVFDLWTAVHLAGGGALLATSLALNFAGLRRTVASKGVHQRTQALAGAALFAALLVALYVVAARHPWQYDATEKKIHTLSEQSRAVAAGLVEPVELLAFFTTGDAARPELADLLGRYTAASRLLTWRFVDPEQEPEFADRFGVARQGVLLARQGERSARIPGDAGAGITEGAVTNLLLRVTRRGPRTVYALTGHGERAPGELRDPAGLGSLAAALRNENLEVRPLLLSAAPGVPEDAALVLVAGPRKPLVPHEVVALRGYLSRGGRALVLVDPGIDTGLEPLLADFRVALGDDMIVDLEQIPFLGARLGLDPIVEEFPSHPLTRNFKERIVLFESRSVDARSEGGLPGVEAVVVARTRPSSWAETDYRTMLTTGRVPPHDRKPAGSVPVAVAASGAAGTASEGKGAARLLVLGDSDLASNAHWGDYFNGEFLLNALEWLAGNDDLIAERPRGFRASRLDMSEADYRTLFRFGVLFFPECLLILGLAVWWRRRSL